MASREEIKQSIKILDEAIKEDFAEIKQDLSQLTDKLKKFLKNTEKTYLNRSQNISMVESWYKFDREFFSNLQTEYNPQVDQFVKQWIIKESDWKYPSCYVAPYSLAFTEHGVKSSLTYVLTNEYSLNEVQEFVRKKLQKTSLATLQMYRVRDLDKHLQISKLDVPYGQIGTLVCIDFLIYCAYEQLINFVQSLNKILRPGGVCLLHFTDADKLCEWDLVQHRKRTFFTVETIQRLLHDTSLEITNIYKLNDTYTMTEIKQQGNLSSQKITKTKIEQVR